MKMLIMRDETCRKEPSSSSSTQMQNIRISEPPTRIVDPSETSSHYLSNVKNFSMLQHNELLVDLNGDLIASQPLERYIPQHYEDDLAHEDLTEDDKRLAAALVAVQLVNQQKSQSSLPVAPTVLTQPTRMVALSDSISSQNIELSSHLTISNSQLDQRNLSSLNFIQSDVNDVGVETQAVGALPPLKRILNRKYPRSGEQVHLESLGLQMETCDLDIGSEGVIKSDMDIFLSDSENIGKPETNEEVVDSDYDENRRNSLLPHKKRIPKKLKTPKKPSIKTAKSQNVSKVGQSKKSGELDSSPSPFQCEICHQSFSGQFEFFEHLKQHYEPLNEEQNVQNSSVISPSKIRTTFSYPTKQNASSLLARILKSPTSYKPWPDVDEAAAATFTEENHHQSSDVTTQTVLTDISDSNVRKKFFRRQKPQEPLNVQQYGKIEMVDEFSDPEDMMAGIRVKVASDDEDVRESEGGFWYREDDLTAAEADLKEIENEATKVEEKEPGEIDIKNVTIFSDSQIKKGNAKRRGRRPKPSNEMYCDLCNRFFVYRNSFSYHMRVHFGKRSHFCDHCGKGFWTKQALKVHLRRHSGAKPYKCETCGRDFRQWSDLKYHTVSKHSDQKNFQCEFCGKEFARKYSLTVHSRIHTGERNYKCEYCGKGFRAASYLLNHRRIHTGEKPHECSTCGKTFRVRSDMKRHLATHNKELKDTVFTLRNTIKRNFKLATVKKPDTDYETNRIDSTQAFDELDTKIEVEVVGDFDYRKNHIGTSSRVTSNSQLWHVLQTETT